MFDGLKFKCENFDLRQLEALPIEPEMCVGFRTGELKKITAECDGLTIEVIQSPETGTKFCRFRGSLQKYANGGAAHAGAFTHAQVCGAVAGLCERFDIDPKTARLENLEISTDLILPDNASARQFLKTLICHGSKPFQPMNPEKPELGRIAPRQEYTFKLYDKGSQAQTGEANLLRVEIRVQKMAYLKPYGIATLYDLTDTGKVAPLGNLLQSVISETVCYDGSVPESSLTTREQMNLKDFCNPNWWMNLHKANRWVNRQKFAAWVEKREANKLFLNVVFSMPSHWENLLSVTRENVDFLSNISSSAQNPNFDFLSRMMRGQKVKLNKNICILPETEKNDGQNIPSAPTSTPPTKRSFFHKKYCRCCGRDISTQKAKSIYCSETLFGADARKCRDSAHNARRREARKAEVERLETLLPTLPALVIQFTVFALDRSEPETPALSAVATFTHAQVYGHPFPGIRQARRVDLTTITGKAFTFTRSFAKRVLSFLASTPPALQPQPPKVLPPDKTAPKLATGEKPRLPMPHKGERMGFATVGEIADKIFDNLIND